MKFEIITIFPEFFRGPLDYGIVRRAREAGLMQVHIHDLRAFTEDKHRTVDDRPFGGGEGMVLKPEPIFACVESLGVPPLLERSSAARLKAGARESVLLLSAGGRIFNQAMADELATLERLVILCGRYEGVDERVAEQLADREVSIGNFVLSGGELAAALILDATTRLLPGALGNQDSSRQESFSTPGIEPGRTDERGRKLPISTMISGGLLDYPHYTRPADFQGMTVPEVLLEGNHEQIRRWRRRKALEKTLRNRPDLLQGAALSEEDKQWIAEIRGKQS
jgi:tRNA (guanine37-N1)-methyltransferase